MKYVLDSNVALKWVLREHNSDKARQLRIDYQQKIHELLAPDVLARFNDGRYRVTTEAAAPSTALASSSLATGRCRRGAWVLPR